MKFKINKAWYALGAAVTPALCFAEGESAADPLQTALDNLQSGIESAVGKIALTVGAVAVAGLVIWGIVFAVKKVRGAVGR